MAGCLLASCAPPPSATPSVPIVLVTMSAVRADVIAADPPRTPSLDAFAARARWAGTAVTASGDPEVTVASLLSGLQPWQHQLLRPGDVWRQPAPLLAERLRGAGYRTVALIPEVWHRRFGAGFDRLGEYGPTALTTAVQELDGATLLWLHLDDAELSERRRSDPDATRAPRRRLLAWADPATPLPEAERARWWTLYEKRLERLDETFGAVVRALDDHPWRERMWVAVTATHGLELGEHQQVLYGENLGRTVIEVPLVLDVPVTGPSGPGRDLAEPRGSRVAQIRLASTLARLAGIVPAPAEAPDLHRQDRSPILSELYGKNGVNVYSWLDGDLQLLRRSRFHPPEPSYFLAKWVRAGGRSKALAEPPRNLFRRLDSAFLSTPPWTGAEDSAALRLERWDGDTTRPVEDPATASRLEAEARRRWMRWVDRERSPAAERQSRRGLVYTRPSLGVHSSAVRAAGS